MAIDEVYLRAERVTKSFGDIELFSDISLSVHKGEKIAMIARNGAGKSTFLQIIAGNIDYEDGEITQKNNIKIAYLEQAPKYNPAFTVEEAINFDFAETRAVIEQYEKLLIDDPKNELNHVMNRIDVLEAWDLDVNINQYLSKLKIADKSKVISTMSGGQVKRLALASVLLKKPDLLILDEPTNHLDLEMIEWLEDYLMDSQTTLLMVTHDRYFLDRVCNRIIELENNQLYSYSGNYEYYLIKREERISQHNTEVDKARQLLKKELEWVNRMPKARSTKAKYRVDNVDKVKEKASRKLMKDKIKLDFTSRRLGNKVIDLYNVSKSFKDLNLITDFSYKFAKGEKVGIIGKNGSGKSTFLNLITEQLEFDNGRMEIGETVSIGYYHQDGIKFDQGKTVIDTVTDIMEVVEWGDGRKLTATGFLNYFLFPPKMQQVQVSKLSGGEKRRLYLMTILMQNPNFLILDEPTNDLDIITLNILEEYLMYFEGCLVIVSHDRYFMDKLSDHLFVFDGKGSIKDFPGNYTDYRTKLLIEEKRAKAKKSAAKKAEKTEEKVQIKNDYSQRLSFKEKHEFENLEKEMDVLSSRKEILEQEMNDGAINHELILEKSKEYEQIKNELDDKEMRWLELSERA